MGSHDSGLTLIEALEAYSDQGSWDLFEGHSQEASSPLFSKLPSDCGTAWYLTKLGGKLVEKLWAREISATAYEVPVSTNDPRKLIPRDRWNFLEPNFHESRAASVEIHLVNVRVFDTLEAAELDVPSHLGPQPGPKPG